MDSGTKPIAAPDEKRESLRQPPMAGVAVMVEMPGGDFQRAELVEVSRTGLRLRTTQRWAADSIVTVGSPAGLNLPRCTARVIREISEPGTDAWFDYGLTFVDTAAEDRNAWFLQLRAREAA